MADAGVKVAQTCFTVHVISHVREGFTPLAEAVIVTEKVLPI
jgi:hypothetical protein